MKRAMVGGTWQTGATAPSQGSVRVIWREGNWRCELGMVDRVPVLQLYDGDNLKLEHKIMPGNVSASAEAIRHYITEQAASPLRWYDAEATGLDQGVPTLCPHCRSGRPYLSGIRLGRNWYFCPECARRWDAPFES